MVAIFEQQDRYNGTGQESIVIIGLLSGLYLTKRCVCHTETIQMLAI